MNGWAMIFHEDTRKQGVYNFNDVFMLDEGIIINDGLYQGYRIDSSKVNYNFLENRLNHVLNDDFDSAFGDDNSELNYESGFNPVTGGGYIAFMLSEKGKLRLHDSLLKADPKSSTLKYAHLTCLLMYRWGDCIENIVLHNDGFKINMKEKSKDIPYRSIDEIIEKVTGTKKSLKQNGELREKREQNSPKADETIGSVDIDLLDQDEVIAKIKEKVIAQDDTVEAVVDALFLNQTLIKNMDDDDITVAKSNILIDGPTGSGKTMIVKELSKQLSLPMVIVNITSFSTTGYKGSDLEDILVKLLDAAGGDLELAQRGIIGLDEFDKLATKNESDSIAMRKALQEDLLAFTGGGKFDINYNGKTIEFDTSNITFIAMGAFTDLRERKIKENEKKNNQASIGFSHTTEGEYSKTYEILPEDYINEGIIRELIGRFTTQTYTKALTTEDMKNIMLNSMVSPLRTLNKLVQRSGKTLVYRDDVIDYIAEKVMEMNTGARALQSIFSPINRTLTRNIRNKDVQEIELTVELVDKLLKKNVRSY